MAARSWEAAKQASLKALCGVAWLYVSKRSVPGHHTHTPSTDTSGSQIYLPETARAAGIFSLFLARLAGKRHSLAPVGLLGPIHAHRCSWHGSVVGQVGACGCKPQVSSQGEVSPGFVPCPGCFKQHDPTRHSPSWDMPPAMWDPRPLGSPR